MAALGLFAVRRTGGGAICALRSGGGGHSRHPAGGAYRCAGGGSRRFCIYGFSIGSKVHGGGHPHFRRQHRPIRHGGLQKNLLPPPVCGGLFPAGAEHLPAGAQRPELAAGAVRRCRGGGSCVAADGAAGEMGLCVRPCAGSRAVDGLLVFHRAGADDGAAADPVPRVQPVPVRCAGGLPGAAGGSDGSDAHGVLRPDLRRRRRRGVICRGDLAAGDRVCPWVCAPPVCAAGWGCCSGRTCCR